MKIPDERKIRVHVLQVVTRVFLQTAAAFFSAASTRCMGTRAFAHFERDVRRSPRRFPPFIFIKVSRMNMTSLWQSKDDVCLPVCVCVVASCHLFNSSLFGVKRCKTSRVGKQWPKHLSTVYNNAHNGRNT